MTALHFVVPDGVDDPALPSGGNVYDRRICRGLERIGWSIDVRPVPGSWPQADGRARTALHEVLSSTPDGSLVLLDGLIACAAPEVLVPEARRLCLVVLVHMPLGTDPMGQGRAVGERAVLSTAAAVVTTSGWTRCWVADRYGLPPGRVHVVEPGVDVAEPAPGTASGGELLCVAAVTPHKGHDALLTALATVADLEWRCSCVGPLTRDPDFVAHLGQMATTLGIAQRVAFPGPRAGADLDNAYARADVLVLASRAETYGMVVTEALARALPVIATEVGGVPEALGRADDGSRPGLLVPLENGPALSTALRSWLTDADLRRRLRRSARQRRAGLSGWPEASRRMSRVLTEVAG